MLSAGVTLLLEEKTVNRRCVNSHVKTFLDHFGVRASTACSIYEDLQVKVGVVHNNESIKWFLISLYYLKNYPKEHQLESTFNINEKYGSKKCWQWIKDVQALQHVKVVMPADWGDDIFAATLDGTDSRSITNKEIIRISLFCDPDESSGAVKWWRAITKLIFHVSKSEAKCAPFDGESIYYHNITSMILIFPSMGLFWFY